MSIYILIDYVETCLKKGIEPKLTEVKEYKEKYWKDR